MARPHFGNRMLEKYVQQSLFLLDEGATPAQVDAALQKWGLAMGPFAMYDMAGNDIGWEIRSEERRVGEEGRSRWSPYHLKKKNSKNHTQRTASDNTKAYLIRRCVTSTKHEQSHSLPPYTVDPPKTLRTSSCNHALHHPLRTT